MNKQLSNKDEKESITGYAYYSDGDCCGYLTVQLEDLSPAPYWVLELGPVVDDSYDYAIVSDNFAFSLFVLARNVSNCLMSLRGMAQCGFELSCFFAHLFALFNGLIRIPFLTHEFALIHTF